MADYSTSTTGAYASPAAPAGARFALVILRGGKGGTGSFSSGTPGVGGNGGEVRAIIPITAGQTVSGILGGDGGVITAGSNGGGAGGNGTDDGGGGGGRSTAIIGGLEMLVAGGGGGGGGAWGGSSVGGNGGAGGGLTGVTGLSGAGIPGGTGGTQVGVGTGGDSTVDGLPGSSNTGGAGAGGSQSAGGGGGGGFFGGGGGAAAGSTGSGGGGGGSSWSRTGAGILEVAHAQGVATTSSVEVTWILEATTFNLSTPGEYTYAAVPGATTVAFTLEAGEGGAGGTTPRLGGAAGRVAGSYPLSGSGGELLKFVVGNAGAAGSSGGGTRTAFGEGGLGGQTVGTQDAGGGGGFTALYVNGVLVAIAGAGGGGGGGPSTGTGGDGAPGGHDSVATGTAAALAGNAGNFGTFGTGGGGGQAAAGGTAGTSDGMAAPTAGASLSGGNGATNAAITSGPGGGGGGGYFGGGGGGGGYELFNSNESGGGGGGGTNFLHASVTTPVQERGVATGNGTVVASTPLVVSKTINVRWDTRAVVTKSRDVRWDTRGVVSVTETVQWDTRTPVSKTLDVRWATRAVVTKTRDIRWDTRRPVTASQNTYLVGNGGAGNGMVAADGPGWNSLVGDATWIFKAASTNYATTQAVFGQWGSAALPLADLAWVVRLTAGILQLYSSSDGTTFGSPFNSTAHGVANGVESWFRIDYDYDNGAAGVTVTFYKSTDYNPDTGGGTWTLINAVTQAGVRPIFNSPAPVHFMGGQNNAVQSPLLGKGFYAEARNGIMGPIVARFDARKTGEYGYTDSINSIQWTAIRAGGTPLTVVSPGIELRWKAILGLEVSKTFEIQWNQRSVVSKTLDTRWAVRQPIARGTWGFTNFGTILSQNRIETPWTADMSSINGDLEIVYEINLVPGIVQTPVARWSATGNLVYAVQHSTGGVPNFYWSSNGTGSAVAAATVTAGSGRMAIKIVFDADNGAAGRTVRFYKCTDLNHETGEGTWVQLGADVVQAGVTSLNNTSASPPRLHGGVGVVGSQSQIPAGMMHYAHFKTVIGGPIVWRWDADRAGPLGGTYTDPAGAAPRVWTIGVDPTLPGYMFSAASRTLQWNTRQPLTVNPRPYIYHPDSGSVANRVQTSTIPASLQISGDFEVVSELVWHGDQGSAVSSTIMQRWIGGSQAWLWRIGADGRMGMDYVQGGVNVSSVTCTVAIPANELVAVKASFDADNGAAGNSTSFYISRNYNRLTGAGTWTLLGSVRTNAGVVTLDAAASAPLGVAGGSTAGTQTSKPLRVYYAHLANGIGGPIVAKWDALLAGPTGAYVDPTGPFTWQLVTNAPVLTYVQPVGWGIQWDTRGVVSRTRTIQWDTRGVFSKILTFYWSSKEYAAPQPPTIYRDTPIPPEFLAALLGPATQVTRRVDIYEEDAVTPFMMDAPFMEGGVQVDMTRAERRIFDLTLDNRDGSLDFYPDGFWYDKVIKMYRGIEYEGNVWETQIGQFIIDTSKTQDFPHSIAINGRDFTAKLMEAEFEGATSYAATVELDDLIKALAYKGQVDKFRIPPTSIQLGKTYMFEGGTKIWDAIVEICTAFGYEVFFDAWGYLVMRSFQDPITAPVAWLFETGPFGNLAQFSKSTNQTRIKNHVVVTGKTTSDIPIYRAVTNMDLNSPTSVPRLKRTKTYKFNSGFVTTDSQALALAQQLLKVQSLESYDLNFSSVVLPWLEAGVIVAFDDPNPAPGDPDKFLLSSFNIPMALGPMSGNARRVTVVQPTSG